MCGVQAEITLQPRGKDGAGAGKPVPESTFPGSPKRANMTEKSIMAKVKIPMKKKTKTEKVDSLCCCEINEATERRVEFLEADAIQLRQDNTSIRDKYNRLLEVNATAMLQLSAHRAAVS